MCSTCDRAQPISCLTNLLLFHTHASASHLTGPMLAAPESTSAPAVSLAMGASSRQITSTRQSSPPIPQGARDLGASVLLVRAQGHRPCQTRTLQALRAAVPAPRAYLLPFMRCSWRGPGARQQSPRCSTGTPEIRRCRCRRRCGPHPATGTCMRISPE